MTARLLSRPPSSSTTSASSTPTSSTSTSTTTSRSSASSPSSTSATTPSSASAAPRSQAVTPPATASRPQHTRTTAPKTADCTNLGTGKHYPCTQQEYDAINEADEPAYLSPTKAQCHNKDEPATLDICTSLGYPYGMSLAEMREYDRKAGSTCANGTQLFFVEHSCRIVSQTAKSTTWSDGTVSRF